MPDTAEIWTGNVARKKTAWADIGPGITRENNALSVSTSDASQARSPYSARFSQGATIVPRALFMVKPAPQSALGIAAGRRSVVSARSSTEKAPWKDLIGLSGTVESEFVWPILLGESVLPFRLLPAKEAVLAIKDNQLLDGRAGGIDAYPGVASWVREAERLWLDNRSSDRLTLKERVNYMRGLTQQIPPSPIRVVYGKAGMHVAAAVVSDQRALIDHKLYWASMASQDEAMFLVSILNTPSLTELCRPLMSYGKDERDIDKHVWKLPIPVYDPIDEDHQLIVKLGQIVTDEILEAPLRGSNFVTQRKDMRALIAVSESGKALDDAVRTLLAG